VGTESNPCSADFFHVPPDWEKQNLTVKHRGREFMEEHRGKNYKEYKDSSKITEALIPALHVSVFLCFLHKKSVPLCLIPL
jgi:hypothetical protein